MLVIEHIFYKCVTIRHQNGAENTISEKIKLKSGGDSFCGESLRKNIVKHYPG